MFAEFRVRTNCSPFRSQSCLAVNPRSTSSKNANVGNVSDGIGANDDAARAKRAIAVSGARKIDHQSGASQTERPQEYGKAIQEAKPSPLIR